MFVFFDRAADAAAEMSTSFRPNIPSRFIVPSSAANLSRAAMGQKLRAATAHDRVGSLGGGAPTSGPHRYLDSNANPVVTMAMRVAVFENNDNVSPNFSQNDLHEHYPLFVARRRVSNDEQAVIALNLFQVQVLLELMYRSAMEEYQAMKDEYLARGEQLPATFPELSRLSEQQLDRVVANSPNDQGAPSVLAFLSRRWILSMFNFAGVQWTNIYQSQPEGPGVTVINEGHCFMKNHCMSPTKEGDFLVWLLKRRMNDRGEFGPFSITMHPTKHADGLEPMECAYRDTGGFVQFGTQLPFATIVEKEQVDPRAENVLMGSGLLGTTSAMAGAALNLPTLVVNLPSCAQRTVFLSY
jgi:hypothetical protein